MVTEKRSIIRRGIPLLLIGLSIFLVYLYFFFGGVTGLTDISAKLQTANLLYYSLAFISITLSMLFSSLTWYRLLKLLSIKIAFRKVFLYRWVGTFVDLLIPAESISGELSKAYLVSKTSSVNSGKAMASIVSHRILTMTVTFGGLIITSVYFFVKYRPTEFVLGFTLVLVASCTAISIAVLGYISVREHTTKIIVDWVMRFVGRISRGRWKLTEFRSKAEKMLKAFHRGINVLARNPRGLTWPVVFSIISWFCNVLVVFLVFASIDFRISFISIIIVYSISASLETIPLGVPGEVGFMEIVMMTLYTLLGVPVDVSAAATVLIRIITLWFRIAVGYASVQWIGIKAIIGGKQSNSGKF